MWLRDRGGIQNKCFALECRDWKSEEAEQEIL